MPPLSSLAGILDSPAPSSNGSTIIGSRGAGGGTLPDISLGSLGSSFHSAEEGEYDDTNSAGTVRGPNDTPVAERPRRDKPFTPFTAHTPGPALLSVSPPASVRRTSSQSAIPEGSHAPRRSRYLRSGQDSDDSDGDSEAVEARYRDMTNETDDDGVLNTLSLNVSHRRTADLRASTSSHAGAGSKRSGRHSVAANPGGSTQMTLREQEQNVDALQKENFNLQLENHFLKERLQSMAPDHIESALKENVKLKIEILNLGKELKRCKKLLMQQDRDLAAAASDRDGKSARSSRADAESRELEAMWREEKEKRAALEAQMAQLRESHVDDKRELEDDLEDARARLDDQAEELARLRDTADRAQDEVDRLQDEARGLSESVGMGRGRESRLVQKLEQENGELQAELEQIKLDLENVRKDRGANDDLEDQINELRDKYAAAQIDLDRRDEEIEELNNELDAKMQDHERELQDVEGEWRQEVIEARNHEEELKDVLLEREQDLEEIRKLLIEREDELLQNRERIGELEAAQGETHDRLEETLRNIEHDNADKDADLIEANREVESLGQRIYDLEEMIEELRARETELAAELQRSDEEKQQFEDLIAALKEARRKAQEERDDITRQHKRNLAAHDDDRDAWEKERAAELDQHRRALASRDQANERLMAELEAARDRVALRDRDLVSVQSALRNLEDERRKIGDERSSDQRSLELEMERLRRDLAACEDELDRARDELRDREQVLHERDLELAQLMDRNRDAESKLHTERQGRLALSDKLDGVANSSRRHEREAATLREKLDELEPLLTETQNSRMQAQRQGDQQRQERTDLLLRVFKDVNRFLGTDDSATPANFGVFRDTLLQRLRSINGVRTDFDKRMKETETRMEQKMTALKRQLDTKWRALDSFEASVKKLELARAQWRNKYSLKEGELDAAKSRNAELQQQITSLRATERSGSNPDSQLRALTDRAQAAEKRATAAASTIAQLESRLAELQSRSGSAENKWEARVKEYESRLRIAGEKIKAEKQGGKERAAQLETQVRDLERQLELSKKHSKRLERVEGVVASAAHLMDDRDHE